MGCMAWVEKRTDQFILDSEVYFRFNNTMKDERSGQRKSSCRLRASREMIFYNGEFDPGSG